MKLILIAFSLLLLTLSAGAGFAQQHGYTQGDIEEGGRLYRINCIGCHGPEGDLVGGIDLGRNRFRRVSSDDEIVDVIMNGVPGTGMPPNPIVRLRAYNVVAYLRNMNATAGVRSVAAATGDAGRGKALFEGKGACNTCHRVRGQGSRSGPDLSEAGLMLRAIEIETSILEPSAGVATSSPPFRAVKKDGTVISGLLLNQDMFTVQLLDAQGALRSIQKSDLREYGLLPTSPMPSYKDKLTPQELADLIAYVGGLKGVDAR
ncbi:MAG TPA: c-type cytochrome [Vicinamibacterales bacterium]|nr:c-type cytochrome [Vicinamibacterales bacterium]